MRNIYFSLKFFLLVSKNNINPKNIAVKKVYRFKYKIRGTNKVAKKRQQPTINFPLFSPKITGTVFIPSLLSPSISLMFFTFSTNKKIPKIPKVYFNGKVLKFSVPADIKNPIHTASKAFIAIKSEEIPTNLFKRKGGAE